MKFILSSELGRLTKWLRLLNYDSYYFKGSNRAFIAKALEEERVVVTSRCFFAAESKVKVFIVKSQDLRIQLKDLKEKLGLKIDSSNMFSRCIRCNFELKELTREEVKEKVPMSSYKSKRCFYRCSKCKQVFWIGSHQELAKKYLDSINNVS
ncbi:MAG: Mut7-C RNAse domain-containing protein [Candidatus Kaelpia aquatica]|nr:Mut7-C RNAse domain-containing protein [Candidatus Kaelpia aquatica]